MNDILFRLLLAHLTGDYLLQPKEMAIKKHHSFAWTGIHVTIYTLSCALWLWTLNPLVLLAIFIPHFIIDYYSLGQSWLRLIKGRTFESIDTQYDMAFTCFVYAVVDNTFHLMCLWAVYWLFWRNGVG